MSDAPIVYVGLETEFGVQDRAMQDGRLKLGLHGPINTSSAVINAYRHGQRLRPQWDYDGEDPLVDQRGFRHEAARDESGTTHEKPFRFPGTILRSGARFYVDHAHPEYCTPEVSNARDAVIWDKAGERIAAEAAVLGARLLGDTDQIDIHKNNTDGKGAAYGCHENYLVPRGVPFDALVDGLTPFFVSRILFVGSGRLGSSNGRDEVDYQISQRADWFEERVGIETTQRRPLINTRDEPHADRSLFRRLHVITSDSNMCEVATYLKVGTMQLLLRMIIEGRLRPLTITNPVAAFWRLSHDPTLQRTVAVEGRGQMSVLDLQEHDLEAVENAAASWGLGPTLSDVLVRWRGVVDDARRDPALLAGRVDWATKLAMLEQYRDRNGLDWEHNKLKAIGLQYHDVRQDKGLYYKLAAKGRVETLVDEAEIMRARHLPPEDTRAYFRGRCIDKFGASIVHAGWSSLVVDLNGALRRIHMMDPGKGTKAHVGALLDRCETTEDLIAALRG